MPLTFSEIENIEKLVAGSRLTEVVIEQDGARTVIGGSSSASPPADPIAIAAPLTATVSFAGHDVGRAVECGEIVARLQVLGDETSVVAPQAGRITAILADEGALVAYGAELLLIEPESIS